MREVVTDKINLDEHGLVACIVQNYETGKVLMLGYMNTESLALTQKSKKVTFYSRSRRQIWQKGETSGNTLELIDLSLDCDGDTLLARVNANGPTCHTGADSCFEEV